MNANWRNNFRYYILLFLIFFIFGLLCFRLFQLMVLEQGFLQDQGNRRVMRTIPIPAYRGMITDRNGEPLAVSTPVESICVNPRDFSASHAELLQLSHLVAKSPQEISKLIEKNKDRDFIYLKRGVPPQMASTVKALQMPGVFTQAEFRRYYPEGEVTAHLLGFTNIDDQGQEGLEYQYNDWLQGIPGLKKVVKDRLGNTVAEVSTLRDARPGRNLVLSIDRRIQYLAYRALKEAANTFQVKSASIVVLDAKTGEILAVANQPSYNPNNRSVSNPSAFRNRAFTDVFEPGSTMKAFSVASAIDSGKYHANTLINTSPGYFYIDGNRVRDEKDNGTISVERVLQLSSNVGVSRMILTLPPDQLQSVLRRVGFGQISDSNFPGERAGEIVDHKRWPPFALATLAFGYGISVTTVQLAEAYAVIADEGDKIPLTLLRREDTPKITTAMNKNVALEMLNLLESVVSSNVGTGFRAKIAGYRVAGKTGTAYTATKGGYDNHRFVSSFVGIAPVSQPRLVIAVVMHEPQGKWYYGGDVAAPVFQKVMSASLRLLNVPPDQIMVDKKNGSKKTT